MFRYSISNWIYGREDLAATLDRLVRFDYDGVELWGEPDVYDPHQVLRLCQERGLNVLSIAGMYPWPTEERDLSNPDPKIRARAVDYLRRCCDFAHLLQAPLIIVVPSAVAKTRPVGDPRTEEAWQRAIEAEWGYAVESVRRAAKYAESGEILLAIEPINRYETFLLNTVEEGLRFVDEVDSEAVKLHLDSFHMNIEEDDPAEAVRNAGDRLINFHVADSNRQGVGRGHIDFRALIAALVEIDYQGALAMEPLPPVPDPYMAIRMSGFGELHGAYAQESIERLKAFEAEVRG
ncbi:MAG: sugar phosphate isomerase/epimerase family protein [Candidatus Bipolaricaulia bacterium]